MCSGNAALNEAAEYPNATGRRSQDVPFPKVVRLLMAGDVSKSNKCDDIQKWI